MAATARGDSWLGGFVRVTKTGRRIFVIHRMVGGRQYEVSTKRSTETAAIGELEKFEKNAAAYTASPGPDLMPGGPPPVYLDAALIKRYLSFCSGGPRPCTAEWW